MVNHGKLDLVGQTFNKLTILKKSIYRKGHHTMWFCQCECGTTRWIRGTAVKTGKTKSCGCIHKDVMKEHARKNRAEHRRRPLVKDLTGQVFGKLTVLSLAKKTNKHFDLFWHCSCACGGSTLTNGSDLKLGRTKSCGCTRSPQFAAAFNVIQEKRSKEL